MSKKDKTEVSFCTATYRLHIMRREFAYHQAVQVAAIEGLEDCLDIHYDVSGKEAEEADTEDCGHISAWAQRVQLANLAVSDVAHQMAQAASLVSELTRGAPEGETKN